MEINLLNSFMDMCKVECDKKGYSGLSTVFPAIKEELLTKVCEKDKPSASGCIDTYIAITEEYVSNLHNRGGRVFDWTNIQPVDLRNYILGSR